jgi:hypothetical protein
MYCMTLLNINICDAAVTKLSFALVGRCRRSSGITRPDSTAPTRVQAHVAPRCIRLASAMTKLICRPSRVFTDSVVVCAQLQVHSFASGAEECTVHRADVAFCAVVRVSANPSNTNAHSQSRMPTGIDDAMSSPRHPMLSLSITAIILQF